MVMFDHYSSPMTKHTHYTSVVFDLDGTLLHTWPGLLAAVTHGDLISFDLLDQMGLKRALSVGIDAMFLEALRQAEISLDATDLALQRLRHAYESCWLSQAQPYDGAAMVLDHLQRKGLSLGLCTNRDSGTTRALLDRLGWTSYFSSVVCIDQVSRPKPDATHLLTVIEALNSLPEDCLYVGDSALDARCAAAAQVDFASHAGGYHLDPQDLQPQIFSFDHHSALLSWLDAIQAVQQETHHG